MTHAYQSNFNSEAADESKLTLDELREKVRETIENELSKSIFETLLQANTESLIVYLIGISLHPILQAHKNAPVKIDDLIKKIFPSKYSLFEKQVVEKIDEGNLSPSIQRVIENDKTALKFFEDLLIFTEVIPVLEEAFRAREWVLWQVYRELKSWHKLGKFQQIEVVIPSEQLLPPSMLRGDLHIRVSASKATVVAGQEFSVFVVVSNPFEVPIVLYSVETQIPIEIVDIVEKQRRQLALKNRNTSLKRRKGNFWNNLVDLTLDRWQLDWELASEPDNRIAQAVSASEVTRVNKPSLDIKTNIEIGNVEGGSVTGVEIKRYQPIDVFIESVSPKYIDSLLWRFDAYRRGVIPIVLQPGNSVVKQFIFRTRSWLFFTPLAHKLQIQVQYSVDDRDHLYTVPFDLTIQAEITAVMIGSVTGSAIGGIARLLSDIKSNSSSVSANVGFLSILLAVILIAVCSRMRYTVTSYKPC